MLASICPNNAIGEVKSYNFKPESLIAFLPGTATRVRDLLTDKTAVVNRKSKISPHRHKALKSLALYTLSRAPR